MKESSGEFTGTLLVIVGAIAVVALLTQVLIPMGQGFIEQKWGQLSNTN